VLKQLDRNGDGRLTADEVPMLGRGGRDGGPGGRGRGEAGRGGEGEAQPTSADDLVAALMAFDENKDGKLAKAELPERYQGLFDRGDVNKDGFLTPAELKQVAAAQAPPANARPEGAKDGRGEAEGRGRPPGGPGMVDPLVAALDVNHDGMLTNDELGGAPAVLRKFDKNGDGRVTFEEIFGAGRGRGGFSR
jgi:Ca2+-binding EF-hand superfamily protein